jgi:cyclopropane fatty-acyl-phospholipid synthase-like methyltransferase
VPLYLSGRAVWQALADLVPPTGRVLDLGSGLGGPLLHLAHHHPGLRGVGIEAAPLPWLISRLRAMGHTRLSFVRGSFWEEDLGAYDFVFAYLSPAVMPRLWRKVQAEMAPGSVFVSVEFPVPGVEPHAVIHTGGRQRLYLWRF